MFTVRSFLTDFLFIFKRRNVMKKTARILVVIMMIAILTMSLASCAKTLRGSYANTVEAFGTKTTTTYTFDGDKFTKTTVVGLGTLSNTTETSGTYEITEEEDQLYITFTVTNDGNSTSNKVTLSEGEEDGVKYIKIDGVKFNKVEK